MWGYFCIIATNDNRGYYKHISFILKLFVHLYYENYDIISIYVIDYNNQCTGNKETSKS